MSVDAQGSGAAGLGGLLVRYRLRAGMTQQEVAERAELSVRALRNIERGLTRPRQRTVAALLDALGGGEMGAATIEEYARSVGAMAGPEPDHRSPAPQEEPARRLSTSSTLPGLPARLIGRESVLEKVGEALAGAGPAQTRAVVIVGAPGVGKTAFAVHVAHRLRDRFPDGQVSLTLGREPDLTGVVARALRLLDVPGGEIPSGLDDALDLYRRILAGRRILVMADNATAPEIRLLLPGSSYSALIATSRSAPASLDGVALATLPALTAEEGIELLADVLGAEKVEAERGAARQIVAACDGLPLALRLAAGRLATHPYRSIGWLAKRLEVGHRRLDELTADDIGVRTSLRAASRGLTRPAQRLLRRLGQFSHVQVSGWLAAAVLDRTPDEADGVVAELVAAHLLEPADTYPGLPHRFIMHDLVGAFARELAVRSEPEAQLRQAQLRVFGAALRRAETAQRVADRALLVMEAPDVARWGDGAIEEIAAIGPDAWFRVEHATLVALTLQACDAGELDYAYGLSLAMSDFHDALRYDVEMQLINERVFDEAVARGHEIAQAYASLARAELSANRGQRHDVISGLQPALDIFRRHRDRLPRAALNAEVIRAHSMRVNGELATALSHAEHLVTIAKRLDDPRAEASACNCLGTCQAWSGDHHGALQTFERGLELYQAAGSVAGRSLCLMRIGAEHASLGSHQEAERALTQALELSVSNGHPQSRPYIFLALAENAIAAEYAADARRYLRRGQMALEQYPDELLSARLLFNRGRLMELDRDYEQACRLYRAAHDQAKTVGGVALASKIHHHIARLTALD